MFTFRRLTREDFSLLAQWLGEPHVAAWWNHDNTPQALEADFGPTIDGDEPAEDFVALLDGEPVGVVQYCHFVDYPEYVEEMDAVYPVGEGAATIDYLVGDPDRVGRGVGSSMIAAFVDFVWGHDAWATHLVVPVNSANEASWRALMRAGFRRVARGELEPDHPDHDRSHEILRRDQADVAPVPDMADPGGGGRQGRTDEQGRRPMTFEGAMETDTSRLRHRT